MKGALNGEVDQQEELGFVRTNRIWNVDCLVLAERWPSWSFALQALRVASLSTVVVSATTKALRELEGTSIGSTLMDVKGWSEGIKDRVTSSSLVFVQGSEAFAAQMEGLLEGLTLGGLFITTPYSAS